MSLRIHAIVYSLECAVSLMSLCTREKHLSLVARNQPSASVRQRRKCRKRHSRGSIVAARRLRVPHSALSASTGSIPAARLAGKTPANNPITTANASANTT